MSNIDYHHYTITNFIITKISQREIDFSKANWTYRANELSFYPRSTNKLVYMHLFIRSSIYQPWLQQDMLEQLLSIKSSNRSQNSYLPHKLLCTDHFFLQSFPYKYFKCIHNYMNVSFLIWNYRTKKWSKYIFWKYFLHEFVF